MVELDRVLHCTVEAVNVEFERVFIRIVEKVILVPLKLEPIIEDATDIPFTRIEPPDKVEKESVPTVAVEAYRLDRVNVLP